MRTDGAGSIGWNQNALTRVAPGDPEAGHWLYLRDIDGGDVWTATGGPFPQPEEPPQVVFHAHQVEFHRRAHGLSATTTITIAHGDALEIRRLSLVNDEDRPNIIAIPRHAQNTHTHTRIRPNDTKKS